MIHRFDRNILLVVIAIEALLFTNFYFREIAWFPPQNFDQAGFLTDAYRLQERVLSNGFGQFLNEILTNGHPSGLGLPIEGALAGLILRGARFPQLCVLFGAFVLLQVVAFTTARAVWNRRIYSYMLIGLILCQITAWYRAGGLFDFRMDFFAYCFYGVWICMVIQSELFLDRRLAVVCGLIAAFLVLNRFLTIVYIAGVGVGFAALGVALTFSWRKNQEIGVRLSHRLRNLYLSFIALGVVVSPVIYFNRGAIYNYYVIGHAVSDEKYVRAKEFGGTGLTDNLLFYPRSIVLDHLGQTFLWASAMAIGSGVLIRLASGPQTLERRGSPPHNETNLLRIVFLFGAILGPIVVLTVDTGKSPIVGGIVGVPMALLVTTLATVAPDRIKPLATALRRVAVACATAIFGLGLLNFFDHASRHLPEYAQGGDLNRLAEVDKWLVEYSMDHDWHHPTISFDVITGWFIAPAITASGYEQLGKLIEFRQLFPTSIMGIDRSEAISSLARSDFFILTTVPKQGIYPFYQKVAQYWNDLKSWADENMFAAQAAQFDGFTATVYVRPSAKISGLSGGWITSAGLDLEVPRAALQRFPRIRLSGSELPPWLSQIPHVAATIEGNLTSASVPASLWLADKHYEILIDTASQTLPPTDPVRLHLTFDAFFVPKKIGLSEDTRELALPGPMAVQLTRPGSAP